MRFTVAINHIIVDNMSAWDLQVKVENTNDRGSNAFWPLGVGRKDSWQRANKQLVFVYFAPDRPVLVRMGIPGQTLVVADQDIQQQQ